MKIGDAPQVPWLGKFITFSAKQEEIVKNAEGKYKLPLVISGSAGSGKTSVALEKLRKIEDEFKEGKILYITKSENLIKESKKLLEYEYYDETADEFKIAAPEKIDFLSLHEFLEKRAEGIKGKKPIDRNKFFSCFNQVCQDNKKFAEYEKDRDKILEEFAAVIAGGGLTKEEYEKLGDRQAVFPKVEERSKIYTLFEEYKKFIEGSLEYYDTSLTAHECVEKVQANYDAVIVDEVQDLTESTLGLILKSLKDGSKSNFLLCGDVNQVIHPSFFSVSRLKSFLHKDSGRNKRELRVCTLQKNYRNSQQVIEIANRILHLKNYCFASEDKLIAEEKGNFFMESDTKNIGNANFITDNKKEEIAKKVSNSKNWAVLILDDESKEDARELFGTPLVFNIHEAKGLEFENVILYKFTSHEAYNKVWNIVCPGKSKKEIDSTINQVRDSYNKKNVKTSRNKDKEDKSFEEHKFYMNALYVGVTRAMSSVYIIDDKSNLLKIIEPKEKGSVNIKKEESSPEEWRDMALKLIDEGNVEQAKDIAIKKLLDKKEYVEKIIGALNHQKCNGEEVEKYTKEIISALEAKERHVEVIVTQSPLDKPCSVGDTVVFEKVKKTVGSGKGIGHCY